MWEVPSQEDGQTSEIGCLPGERRLGPRFDPQACVSAAWVDPGPFPPDTQPTSGCAWHSLVCTFACVTPFSLGDLLSCSWENLPFVKAWMDESCLPMDSLREKLCRCLPFAHQIPSLPLPTPSGPQEAALHKRYHRGLLPP